MVGSKYPHYRAFNVIVEHSQLTRSACLTTPHPGTLLRVKRRAVMPNKTLYGRSVTMRAELWCWDCDGMEITV